MTPVDERATIGALVARLARRARWVRAASRAAAALPWGLGAAAALLLVRDVLPPTAPWAALAVAVGPSLLVLVVGLVARAIMPGAQHMDWIGRAWTVELQWAAAEAGLEGLDLVMPPARAAGE